jgi:hypothetical protein
MEAIAALTSFFSAFERESRTIDIVVSEYWFENSTF